MLDLTDSAAPGDARPPLVAIRNLRVEFETNDGTVLGVEDVSFDIAPGECVCVVGESG